MESTDTQEKATTLDQKPYDNYDDKASLGPTEAKPVTSRMGALISSIAGCFRPGRRRRQPNSISPEEDELSGPGTPEAVTPNDIPPLPLPYTASRTCVPRAGPFALQARRPGLYDEHWNPSTPVLSRHASPKQELKYDRPQSVDSAELEDQSPEAEPVAIVHFPKEISFRRSV